MPRLYLDIDGVLLTKRLPRPADGVEGFIAFAVKNFDCYWLTTHCKGSNLTVLKYLKPYFDSEAYSLMATVKPTNWDTLKTEAIDFDSDFYWLDDAPLNIEIKTMCEAGKSDRLILVDLAREKELVNIQRILQASLGK